jgi:hypothetical protein
MSYQELNKGMLLPVSKKMIEGMGKQGYDEEWFLDNDYIEIDGKWFKMYFDIQRQDISTGHTDYEINSGGSIEFLTIHYNGGAGIEEVLTDMLKGKIK